MMSLFWTLAVIVHIAGWLPASAATARYFTANHPYCHQETDLGTHYKWDSPATCARFDLPGCWRVDTRVSFATSLGSFLVCVIWPLAALPAAVYIAANRAPVAPAKKLANHDLIRQLERETLND